jgi:hypothetical protein
LYFLLSHLEYHILKYSAFIVGVSWSS